KYSAIELLRLPTHSPLPMRGSPVHVARPTRSILRRAQNEKYKLVGDTAGSENVKSSHQFLARFHRLRWIHPAKHLFAAFTVHCCELAHELVARFPFCVFACANAECEKRGDDPNGNVGRGDEKHKRRKSNVPPS